MQFLANSTDTFFAWLWRASWQASLVIALVAFTQAVLHKRLSPRWRHGLWLLVIIRLALPCSVETRLSLFNCFSPNSAGFKAGSVVPAALQAASSEDRVVLDGPLARGSSQTAWWRPLRWLWLAGAVALCGYVVVTSYRLSRAVRQQRPVTDEAVLNLLEDCKQEMTVSTPLTLVETPNVRSPALLGFVRPRVLLPTGLTRVLSLAELRYVFLHELGHLKRSDVPLNWLMSIALAIHWFNPLVWYAFSRLRAERELACDELALTHAREAERQPYGQTVIKLLELFSRPAIAPGLLGILETKNQMKRRITMIAKFRKTNDWPILALLLAVTLALLTLIDARSAQSASAGQDAQAKPEGPPRIIATSPKVRETEVGIDMPYKGDQPPMRGFAINNIPGFWLKNGEVAKDLYVAFTAKSADAARPSYEAAIDAGATSIKEPSLRPEWRADYFAANIGDPDGYNIEIAYKPCLYK